MLRRLQPLWEPIAGAALHRGAFRGGRLAHGVTFKCGGLTTSGQQEELKEEGDVDVNVRDEKDADNADQREPTEGFALLILLLDQKEADGGCLLVRTG